MANKASGNDSSPLLKLPPELRSHVYRFALLSVRPIEVEYNIDSNVALPTPPALLQMCRQVRAEAYGIYYRKNTFYFCIEDFDATALIQWCRHFPWESTSKEVENTVFTFYIAPSSDWSDLLQWLEAVFHGQATAIKAIPGFAGGNSTDAACALLKMASVMGREGRLSWRQARRILGIAREGYAAFDAAWGV